MQLKLDKIENLIHHYVGMQGMSLNQPENQGVAGQPIS